jgi:hypothetical protein
MDFCNLEGPRGRAAAAGCLRTRAASHALPTCGRPAALRPRVSPPPFPQGDNDPVDVVEIGSTQLKMGGVYKVRGATTLAPAGRDAAQAPSSSSRHTSRPAPPPVRALTRRLPGARPPPRPHATPSPQVKPLGVYAMIDDGELDWKVIAIEVNDPKAAAVNSLEDVER